MYWISHRPLADRILPKLSSPHLQFSTPAVRCLKLSSIVVGKPRAESRSAGWIPYPKYSTVFLSLYENVAITEITPWAFIFTYSNPLFAYSWNPNTNHGATTTAEPPVTAHCWHASHSAPLCHLLVWTAERLLWCCCSSLNPSYLVQGTLTTSAPVPKNCLQRIADIYSNPILQRRATKHEKPTVNFKMYFSHVDLLPSGMLRDIHW